MMNATKGNCFKMIERGEHMEGDCVEYKGYKIYKQKQDDYMRKNNLHYMAYDSNENLFDGAETLEEMKQKINKG